MMAFIGWVQKAVEAGDFLLATEVLFGIPVMTTSEGIGYAGPERDGATPWVALGPAYVEGAPHISNPGILPMRPDEPGEVVFVSGSVTSTQGRPLAGAVIDIWQNDKNGKYSSMTYESAGPMPHIVDLSAPEYNLRGKITTDGQGRYAYRTILPGPEILTPLDGALGKLLTLLDRSISRPLHIHSTIRADGCRELTHQILFDFDPLTEHASEGPVDPRTIFRAELREAPVPFGPEARDGHYYDVTCDYVLRPE
jgi:catechol 1,2-dioxygenase